MSMLTSPEHGVAFDLQRIAEELRAEGAYAREGHTARTLVHTPDLRIVVVVLKAGDTISEHHANVTASVQTVSGQIRLQLPDRAVELSVGHVLVLGTTRVGKSQLAKLLVTQDIRAGGCTIVTLTNLTPASISFRPSR